MWRAYLGARVKVGVGVAHVRYRRENLVVRRAVRHHYSSSRTWVRGRAKEEEEEG